MSDRPDYTLPVSIEAITIESLPVDILAQTIGNIAIDIASQTGGDIDINIATADQPVTIRNVMGLINGGFEEDLKGWGTSGEVIIDEAIMSLGYKSCKLAYQASIFQDFDPSLASDDINLASIRYRISKSGSQRGHVRIYYHDGTYSTTYLSPAAANTWYTKNLSWTMGKQVLRWKLINLAGAGEFLWVDDCALSLRVTVGQIMTEVEVNICTADIGELPIDIASQTIGNIAINLAEVQGTVNINVKTSGGVNIVIDKLTQTAYLEDRRTLSNNGDTASWDTKTADGRDGKFFPRGCRGFIHVIEVHCKDDAAAGGTITIYISPHPGMGYIASADVTVPSSGTAAWRSATFSRMWNYDSMFIFAVCSSSDIKFGYDEETPYDRFYSTDAGATWLTSNHRYWFRASMKAMTVGDLPVSGTINTIEIPRASTTRLYNVEDVTTSETTLKEVDGAGDVKYLTFHMDTGTGSEGTILRVYCDGVLAFRWTFAELNDAGFVASTPGISLLKYNVNGENFIIVTLPFNFTRALKLTMDGVSETISGWIEGLVNLIK